ncbi:unnamed protein product [Rotaria sp. Silwood2]|nr:unnamed protein product [Rotaria sp. Silwood2]CAF3992402.1 unnamed protein product [Rotaria sp. Silwood2]
MQNGKKAKILRQWADERFLAQTLPNSPMFLRSDRVIDYALVRDLNLDIQAYNGNTTSDHLPILSVIPLKVLQKKLGKNTHWKHNKKKEICFLKIIAKRELNPFFPPQLDNFLHLRNSPSSSSNSFWYRGKRFLKPSFSSIHAFIDSSGQIVKESDLMCNVAADYYENFFKASNIIRPHPYTESPPFEYDNNNEVIPEVTLDELFLDQLEYYSCLTDQPISFNKTEAMFSARAIGHSNFVIRFCHETKEIIKWVPEYKYLGYLISLKSGWVNF